MIGILGGFTTFSSFENDTINLMHEGESINALANVGANVILGLMLVWLGRTYGRILDLEINMQLPHEGTLLRSSIGEADRYQGKPLNEWIVQQARELGLAGTTVLRGMIEIVETTEKLDKFLEQIEPHIKAGLLTLEKAQIRAYWFEQ